MFKRIAIIGLGLIGGSIAHVLKKKHSNVYIVAYGRNPEVYQNALEEGLVDRIASLQEIDCQNIDLIVVATPVLSSIDIIVSLLNDPDLNPESLIIDAGSVKYPIERVIINHANAQQFIGCHPMAGSEKSGYKHSAHTILYNAWVIITPHEKNKRSDIQKIADFWRMLDCRVHMTDAMTHDKMVARSSHLPHITSTALMDFFVSNINAPLESIYPFIGKGFKDMTRLAGGSPDMWADITLLNSENLLNAIDEYIHSLSKIKDIIQKASLHNDRTLLYHYFDDVKNKWKMYHE